jgi:hypothetical protein
MKLLAASKILRREAEKHIPSDPKKRKYPLFNLRWGHKNPIFNYLATHLLISNFFCIVTKFKISLKMEVTRKLKLKSLLLAA